MGKFGRGRIEKALKERGGFMIGCVGCAGQTGRFERGGVAEGSVGFGGGEGGEEDAAGGLGFLGEGRSLWTVEE